VITIWVCTGAFCYCSSEREKALQHEPLLLRGGLFRLVGKLNFQENNFRAKIIYNFREKVRSGKRVRESDRESHLV